MHPEYNIDINMTNYMTMALTSGNDVLNGLGESEGMLTLADLQALETRLEKILADTGLTLGELFRKLAVP